jgi:uncharacterized repeat protein (TIGR04076 family)
MKKGENPWGFLQKALGYSDEEMELFLADPRNREVLEKGAGLFNKTIVVEVKESHGCFLGHKAGDKLYFDGGGAVITSRCPKKICTLALSALAPQLFAVAELYYAGIDPNDMRFSRVGCPDVGLACGGWGHVVMELSVTDRA